MKYEPGGFYFLRTHDGELHVGKCTLGGEAFYVAAMPRAQFYYEASHFKEIRRIEYPEWTGNHVQYVHSGECLIHEYRTAKDMVT